ncbi:hypothetical protein [Nocardioides sp.]|uniref:hypothetical protein n=1 Tax=Nocardioides sp. TaxID=35761 RepID=UPI002610101F|nr:hypothetical protein [Nocardioides sp.]
MNALLSVPLTRRLHRVPVVRLLHGRLAERAWSWDWEDQWTREWWPQGITWAGERLLVSWYAKSGGSRVSVVDLETRRYAHVTLLTPTGDPLKIHAGGLAWADGWLYVAATGKGFWTFHTDDLAAVEEVAQQPSRNPATWQATAVHRPAAPADGPPLRWSFLDASGPAVQELAPPVGPAVEEVAQQPSRNPGPTHLYAGEYGRGNRTTRVWLLPVADGQPAGPVELLATGPKGMQGVTATDSGLVVSTSHGPWTRGSLHHVSAVEEVAQQPSRNPDRGALPIGVEDLTRDESGHLWTPAEHPGRRAIVQLRPTVSH